MFVTLTFFTIAWVAVLYGFDSFLAPRRIRISVRPMLVYVTGMAAGGVCAELVGGNLYRLLFGHQLWVYQLLPIHSGYTSVYSPVLWGMLGFHMYLLHSGVQKKAKKSVHVLAGIFCAEALVLEVLVNLTFLAAFGGYIFYYNPADLWHLTSVQAALPYLLTGYIALAILPFAKRQPGYATLGSIVLGIGLVATGLLSRA